MGQGHNLERYAVIIAPPLDIIYKQNQRSCLATKPGTLWGPPMRWLSAHTAAVVPPSLTHAVIVALLSTSDGSTLRHLGQHCTYTLQHRTLKLKRPGQHYRSVRKTKTISPSHVVIFRNISLTLLLVLFFSYQLILAEMLYNLLGSHRSPVTTCS